MKAKWIQFLVLCLGVTAIFTQFEHTNKKVRVETSMGSFTIELFVNQAPISVRNFLQYAEDGHYNGTIFHRVIPEFMIQGGGLTADLSTKKTRSPIANEAQNGLKNRRAMVGMARIDLVESATDQFYINVVDNDFLNFKDSTEGGFGYAVFGEVIKGMEVIDQIATAETEERAGYKNLPKNTIQIIKVTLL